MSGTLNFDPYEDHRDVVEIAIGRVPTKRYGELEDVKLTADACPSCLSHHIDDFDTSERGDNRPHRHCWTCGRVWLKEV